MGTGGISLSREDTYDLLFSYCLPLTKHLLPTGYLLPTRYLLPKVPTTFSAPIHCLLGIYSPYLLPTRCLRTHYLPATDQAPNARRYFLPPGYLPTTYYVRTDQTNEVPPYCILSTYYPQTPKREKKKGAKKNCTRSDQQLTSSTPKHLISSQPLVHLQGP